VIRWIVALLFVGAVAQAEDEPAETASGDVPVVSTGATTLLDERAAWRWELVIAPRLAQQIGAVTVSGLDAVAKRGPVVDVLGDAVPAPAAWPYDVKGTVTAIPAPAEGQRIAAAFGIATFALTPAQQGLEVLELKLKYEDGVAVWLNGIEIVRQGLPRGPTTTLAVRPHGPEWETFFVPVAPGLLRAENVLAIEVHPSGRSDGAKVQSVLAGRKDRGIVRGPIIAALEATTATIAVETDAGVDATIEWGTKADALARTKSSPAGKRHRFELDGLPANGDVFYRVSAGVSRTQVYAFHTLPPPAAVIRIGVYGDVRGGHAVHRKIVEQMLREGLDLVAVTGDMVLRGPDEADWQRFFAVTRDLLARIPYYPAVGNHDLGWGGAHHDTQSTFGLPPGPPGRPAGAFYYSRDIADIHLVFLDSNAYDRPEQETWLASDLAAARARKVRAIIAITHDGPYARGYHGGSAIARDRYVPILLAQRVDLLFSGHDHIYQRGDAKGLRYVVSGGGGASLYGIRCGVSGRPKCKIDDGMQMVAKEHHYLVVTIGREIELCARKPDGTLLERCTKLRLLR
jgi:acid phosphatase type 7